MRRLIAAILSVLCVFPLFSFSAYAESPKTYPLSFSSKYEDYLTTAPKIIWSSTGSENHLGGSVYLLSGTVEGIYEIRSDEETIIKYFVLQTDNGPVQVSDYEFFMRGICKTEEDLAVYESLMRDPELDSSFPSVGEAVYVMGTYVGFSRTYDMPSFLFGITEYFVNEYRLDAAKELIEELSGA